MNELEYNEEFVRHMQKTDDMWLGMSIEIRDGRLVECHDYNE